MQRIWLALFFAFIAFASTMDSASAVSKKASGSIAGTLSHPARRIPAMQVCAVNANTQRKVCIKTKADSTRYKILRLPAGEYEVIARAASYPESGAYRQSVQCIRAPCPPVIGAISLAAGQHYDQANITFPMPNPPAAAEK